MKKSLFALLCLTLLVLNQIDNQFERKPASVEDSMEFLVGALINEIVEKEHITKSDIKHYLSLYPSEVVANSIVYRFHRLSTDEITNSFAFKNTELVLFTKLDRIKETIQDIGIINAHYEGVDSSGETLGRERREVESFLLSLDSAVDLDESADLKELLPKYAVAQVIKDIKKWPKVETASVYGNLRIVLSDDLKLRSTITGKDSLILEQTDRLEANVVSNFSADENSLRGIDPSGYIEAQIYGRIGVEDIKEFRIENIREFEDNKMFFKELGLPVYLVSPHYIKFSNNHRDHLYSYVPRVELYGGSKSKMRKYREKKINKLRNLSLDSEVKLVKRDYGQSVFVDSQGEQVTLNPKAFNSIGEKSSEVAINDYYTSPTKDIFRIKEILVAEERFLAEIVATGELVEIGLESSLPESTKEKFIDYLVQKGPVFCSMCSSILWIGEGTYIKKYEETRSCADFMREFLE